MADINWSSVNARITEVGMIDNGLRAKSRPNETANYRQYLRNNSIKRLSNMLNCSEEQAKEFAEHVLFLALFQPETKQVKTGADNALHAVHLPTLWEEFK